MTQLIGRVSHTGTVEIGSGFQSEKHSNGLYKVFFDSGKFTSTPVVIATPDTSNFSSETYTVAVSLKNVSTSGFTLSIENLDADTKEAAFNFVAYS
ncbi:H-type lectin domain-containing protein [Vibrio spartinae]|uniref:H-type lectin domain-containing protein n=1 Tax=Vibrio spartinae TaxID=1918945 RepID=A0A1N6MB59_9VIBR|nr:H-type lectin domain-containing protein [Vibrio spartinae]SIO96695.1 hypothetical protein VSP9026_04501 [Vibrio spartinae]